MTPRRLPLPCLILTALVACGGGSEETGSGGGGTTTGSGSPADPVCELLLGTGSQAALSGTAAMVFDGQTLNVICRPTDSATAFADIRLRTYPGPGQTVTVTSDGVATGVIDIRSQDGINYSTLNVGAAEPECTVTVTQGPDQPANGEPISLTFACSRLYGYPDGSTDIRETQVTDGLARGEAQ